MSSRDYYEILGVPRTSSADEIRKAYKKLARKYHPDANAENPDSQQKFAEITEAHEVLGDSDKRQKYDQFGHNWNRVPEGATGGSPFGGFGGGHPGGGSGFSLDDILGGVFGGAGGSPFGGRPQARKGEDLRTSVRVAFLVGVEGGEHELTVRTGDKAERLTFRIPSGMESGKSIRLAGQGHPGQLGGPRGDVLVTVEVAPHPYFRRDGFNLILDVPVSVTEAALGAKIDVPTLTEGTVILSVPPGTSSGGRLRLRGKGVMNRTTGKRGDQFVVIKVTVPKELNDEARDLLQRLDEVAPENPRDGLWP
ncbi:MAG: DnaJ domain-containing protein [Fuerstiella sp.]|nr:DnaJ domain-containing protein [Fuerstiella sp.]